MPAMQGGQLCQPCKEVKCASQARRSTVQDNEHVLPLRLIVTLYATSFPFGSVFLFPSVARFLLLPVPAMQVLRVVHPPGGATALIAVTSPPILRNNGLYIIYPVLSGIFIMLAVALVVNNFKRQ